MNYIIAEIGVNHNGSVSIAKKLIDVAVDAKACAVKFQTFKSDQLASSVASKAQYQKTFDEDTQNQLTMLKKLELSYDEFKELFEYCKEKDIDFISTPFDLDSVDFLDSLGVNIFKIGSGDLTNYLLLKKVALKNKRIILSTGMATMEEVENAVKFIRKYNNDIVLLYCVSSYPTQIDQLNLKCIDTLRKRLNIDVGFSDHSLGYEGAIIAKTLGANIFEKHFTLDKDSEGPDHKASLDPEELKEYIKKINLVDIILGDGEKKCQECEKENRYIARRSLAFNKDKKKGEIIKEEDLVALRPASGLCPSKFEEIIGKKLQSDTEKNNFVDLTYI